MDYGIKNWDLKYDVTPSRGTMYNLGGVRGAILYYRAPSIM